MLNLTVGFNFTQEHFDVLMATIQKPCNGVKIGGIYGSPGAVNIMGSVREPHRESTPHCIEAMDRWLAIISKHGLEVNMTLNSLVYPDEQALLRTVDRFIRRVDNFIVAHPGVIDLMHEECPQANIIISTIMNVHTLPQVQWIKDNWPQVVRICPAIEKNRDCYWLNKANKIVPLELLANEFCSMGGVTCEGLYRQACYMGQSLRQQGWCARDKCMEQRKENSSAWLKSYFILPQWLPIYNQATGVKHFKITGRTHGPDYFKYIMETYLNSKATGNLLSLWGQLESTFEGANQSREQATAIKATYIPIDVIEDINFWACHPDDCGRICKKCDILMENFNE